MTSIKLYDNKCWRCGTEGRVTDHHGIPQRLKPKNNVIIPICQPCHDEINNVDINGMYSYAYRIECLCKQLRNNSGKFLKQMKGHLNSEQNSKTLNKKE